MPEQGWELVAFNMAKGKVYPHIYQQRKQLDLDEKVRTDRYAALRESIALREQERKKQEQ